MLTNWQFSLFQNIVGTRQAFSIPSSNLSSVSVNAPPFYPAADTVESVVESALDDLNLDDFDVTELEKELNNASPVSSTLGDSLSVLNVAPMCSAPVTIPGAAEEVSPQAFTQSPTSPLGQFSSSYGSASQLMSGQKVMYSNKWSSKLVWKLQITKLLNLFVHSCTRVYGVKWYIKHLVQ